MTPHAVSEAENVMHDVIDEYVNGLDLIDVATMEARRTQLRDLLTVQTLAKTLDIPPSTD